MPYELEKSTYIYLEQGTKKLLVTPKAMIGSCKVKDFRKRNYFQFTNEKVT